MSRVLALCCLVAAVSAGSLAIAEEKSAEPPWRVTDPHGPATAVSFTTDEGTWLHLDVHPGGEQLVFSLLGDLYLLPLVGGEARRITSGPAYDVQPRFSPDGKLVAFASDRGGLENLWICGLDGGNVRQVSSEKERTVSAPAWSQDGQYLIGRKRLTDLSSLGTVELWMWHLKGGQGVQVTKKDDQPDAAEPAFGREGRFLYYAARDARYQYNRNVYDGIWQVKRLDRRSGQVIVILSGAGGAAAPVLSPDGRSLAYVRRSAARTRIEMLDLATGRKRLVADDVTRDGQEGFAFHGTFPGYAFTPDGKEIVATAGGRIWRFDVATGARKPVPFTARVEQSVTDAQRVARSVGDGAVRARIVRWPVESPDGKRLVFSALGHLYGMDLPAGAPRRLTSARELEYAPSFSRDGRSLAYVTWSDAEGGHVWVMAAGGGTPRKVTPHPGHYANPAFSPDGSRIAFVAAAGAALRDQDLADEPWLEIRWVPAAGGRVETVIGTKNRGANRPEARPAFSADGQRIYYIEDEDAEKPSDPGKTVLASVKLDGTDRLTHLRWPFAEEAAVSPDGQWVAWRELHDVFVTALPQVGKTAIDVATKEGALPVAQLTEEGGDWVGWADGGRTVTWSFGPVYHRIALGKALPDPEPPKEPAPDAAPAAGKEPKEEKKPLPESEAIEIRLEVPREHGTGAVAYVGARLVTMKGDEVIEDGALVVEDDRIVSVGVRGSVAIPAGARQVDLGGKTLLPGLIDAHAHLHYASLDVLPERPWRYLANLAYGVTTCHDPSAATHEVFAQAEMVEAGLAVGPRILSTGFVLYGADGAGKAIVASLDDARHHVRRLKRLGAIAVKSYMQPRREQRQWILQAAREEGMMVVPEGGGDLEMDMTMVLDGHTTIEHALPVAPLYKDVVGLLGKSRTAYTPTLLVAYGGLSGENWFYQKHEVWKDERLLRYVPSDVVERRSRVRPLMAADDEWHHDDVAAGARAVLREGGMVCLGAHGQLQGLGPHWELWAFVQGGMSTHEALRVATLMPARALGLDQHLGSLEPGKLADFFVVGGNPLARIEDSAHVELVVKAGKAYRPEELERVRRAAEGGK